MACAALEKTYRLALEGRAEDDGSRTALQGHGTGPGDDDRRQRDRRDAFENGSKVLRDDKHAFPPYQVCIVARQDAMQRNPRIAEALLELSGKFTNQQMQNLNFQVDAEHRPVAQVAAEFLRQAGLN